MGEFFQRLFSSDFMPHGMCYLWNPAVLWLNVISDGLISIAYYAIPVVVQFEKRVMSSIAAAVTTNIANNEPSVVSNK